MIYRPHDTRFRDRFTNRPRPCGNLSEYGLRTTSAFDSLLSWWRLDGDGADAYGACPLTAYGAIGWSTGKRNQCAVCPGGSAYLSTGDQAALKPAQITMACWINETATGFNSMLANGSGWYWLFGSVSSLYLRVTAGGSDYTAVLTGLNTGTWRHIVMTHNEAALVGYVDGNAQIVTTPAAGTRAVGAYGLSVANGYSFYSKHYTGNVDEIGMWSRALSAAEVLDLYNAGAGIFY